MGVRLWAQLSVTAALQLSVSGGQGPGQPQCGAMGQLRSPPCCLSTVVPLSLFTSMHLVGCI